VHRLTLPIALTVLVSTLAAASELTPAQWLEASVIKEGVVMSPLAFSGILNCSSGGLLDFGNWSRSNIRFKTDTGISLLMHYDTTKAWVHDSQVRMPAAPIYVKWRSPLNVRVLVPVRWVVETLGGQVTYDQDTRRATLTGPRGTISFVPRGTLDKPERMYYQVAGRLYPRDQYLRGTIYFPLGEFEALGGSIPARFEPRETINGETCAPLTALLEANGGRLAMEWVDDAVTEVVLWMPQTGEIRTEGSPRSD
jgi:hypothetical protein